MKNKKINELKNIPSPGPSIEEQQAFIDELVQKLRKDGASLQQWIEKFKKEHGVNDEDL